MGEDNFEKIQGIMKIKPFIASAVVASTSGQLLGGDTASLGPQDRFQRQKRINDEVTVIDGNSIPESGLLSDITMWQYKKIATTKSSLKINFDDLKSIEFSDLNSGSNCSISGITFEDSSSRSTPKCGTDQEVNDTSVTLSFENDQVDLSQVRYSISDADDEFYFDAGSGAETNITDVELELEFDESIAEEIEDEIEEYDELKEEVKDEAKTIAMEDVINEELEADIDSDLELKEKLEYDNDQLEYQIEEKEVELEDIKEQDEDDEIIFDQGEIIKRQSEENQLLQEEVNATKDENKELKDKNEILEEDTVYFIAGDIDASDVADDLGESIKISRPTKSQEQRTWVSTKEINATYDQLSGLLLSVASMCVFVSMFFIVSMAMGFILIKWKRTQIANYWIRDLSKILGRREKADKTAIIKEEANRMALDNGDIIYTGKTDVCQA